MKADVINVVNLNYYMDKEIRNVQDSKMGFSIIDLNIDNGDQSDWDGGFILGTWFQAISDIP